MAVGVTVLAEENVLVPHVGEVVIGPASALEIRWIR